MNISFVWENALPSSQSEAHIQSGLLMALEVANSRRNLDPEKLIARLTTDITETAIDGIGYDQDEKPLFIFSCSMAGPSTSYYCYYYGENDPRKSQFSGAENA